MKFGATPVADSLGGVVVHAVRREGFVLRKGDVIDAARIEALRAHGVGEIVVARLEAGDVGEDEAARRLAQAAAGAHVRIDPPATGRSNLFAETAGVLVVDVAAIDAINAVDEEITIATLPAWRAVVAGEMIATVKIIPFAVPQTLLDRAVASAANSVIRVAPYRALKVGVVSTLLPGFKPSTVKKTLRTLADRLAPAGARIVVDVSTPHETAPLSEAIEQVAKESDLVVVFGASAITDRRDVIPAALTQAGGRIEQLGMPVDPGNLLLLGRLPQGGRDIPLLGAPGCARSPKENGFDWVLQRLLADTPVSARDIRRMGVGGLLMEIVQRGHPRETRTTQDGAQDAALGGADAAEDAHG